MACRSTQFRHRSCGYCKLLSHMLLAFMFVFCASMDSAECIDRWTEDQKLHFYVSPFQRTLQTAPFQNSSCNNTIFCTPTEARNIIFSNFDPEQVVHVSVDPRIREQEFGNLQGGKVRRTLANSIAIDRGCMVSAFDGSCGS